MPHSDTSAQNQTVAGSGKVFFPQPVRTFSSAGIHYFTGIPAAAARWIYFHSETTARPLHWHWQGRLCARLAQGFHAQSRRRTIAQLPTGRCVPTVGDRRVAAVELRSREGPHNPSGVGGRAYRDVTPNMSAVRCFTILIRPKLPSWRIESRSTSGPFGLPLASQRLNRIVA